MGEEPDMNNGMNGMEVQSIPTPPNSALQPPAVPAFVDVEKGDADKVNNDPLEQMEVEESYMSARGNTGIEDVRDYNSCGSRLFRFFFSFIIVLYYGLGICFSTWSSWKIGEAGKWGWVFMWSFGGLPVLWCLLSLVNHGVWLCIPKEMRTKAILTMCLVTSMMSGVYAFGITFPVAVTGGRWEVANSLQYELGNKSVSANCYNNPTPEHGQKNWDENVEFIRWGDPNYYIDRSSQSVAKIKTGLFSSEAHLFCAAPVRLATSGDPALEACSGYRAMAMCYDKNKEGRCSAAAMTTCGWDVPANLAFSRVLRKHDFYSAYQDQEEKKKFQEARKNYNGPMMGGSEEDPLLVWWMADKDPFFFAQKRVELDQSIYVQLVIYASIWGGIGLCIAIYTSLADDKEA